MSGVVENKAKLLPRLRSAETLPCLGFGRLNQTDLFPSGSIVDSRNWSVLHRPSEPAGFIRTWDGSQMENMVGKYSRDAKTYSAIMRSAHSTRETKMAGLPNFALQVARSFSETPRARLHAPQAKTGMCLATTFSRNSLSGGQPMGITASDVALRMRYVASAVRNI